MNFQPVVLAGRRVRLQPLGHEHASDLLAAAAYDEIWTYLDEPTPRDESAIRALIDDAIAEQAAGSRLPFAIVEASTGRAVGARATSTFGHEIAASRSDGRG